MSDEEFVFNKKSGETGGGEHPDAERNKTYFDSCWSSREVQDKVSIFRKACDECSAGTTDSSIYFSKHYMGIDPTTTREDGKRVFSYRELTGVQIMWRFLGVNRGFSLSFHKPNAEFKEECDKILAKKDTSRQNSYKSWLND